jgi:bacillithiol system protein YtxJ
MEEITSQEQLDAALEQSNEQPVFLFKHSTACPISAGANDRVRQYVQADDAAPVYLVKVIESRPVSNAVAERLGVAHKSPQVILVRNGEAQWDASHHGVRAERMAEALGL